MQAATEVPVFDAIKAVALVDDAFDPITLLAVPDSEAANLAKILQGADLADAISGLGFEDTKDILAVAEALSDPSVDCPELLAAIRRGSGGLADLIEDRRRMCGVVNALRAQGIPDVRAYRPSEDRNDIGQYDLVFLDYTLERGDDGGGKARAIAKDIESKRDRSKARQTILMSSRESVRNDRVKFRRDAEISGTAFAFIPKSELDRTWKVRAHLETLARALPNAKLLETYISNVVKELSASVSKLESNVLDLDIGDFSYIGRILHDDGQPLGDYLSWLIGSRLQSLCFDGDVRSAEKAVDEIAFADGVSSSAEPSTLIAQFYHDALFSGNHGPLGAHPLAGKAYPDVAHAQLGDVLFDAGRTKAVVILSAACDLAFSPIGEKRKPDPNRSVLLVYGTPHSITTQKPQNGSSTAGYLKDDEVYRIDWDFKKYRSSTLGGLIKELKSEGFDVGRRDRLRPLYALKLQQEFSANLVRIGPPVAPPMSKSCNAAIMVADHGGSPEKFGDDLALGDAILTFFDQQQTLRLTTNLVGQLQAAAEVQLSGLNAMVADLPCVSQPEIARKAKFASKAEKLAKKIEDDAFWSALLRDHKIPDPGKIETISHPVMIARGMGWKMEGAGIVLVVEPDLISHSATAASSQSKAPSRPQGRASAKRKAEASTQADEAQSLAQSEEPKAWRSQKGKATKGTPAAPAKPRKAKN